MADYLLKNEAKVVRWHQGDDFVAVAATTLVDGETGWTVYAPPRPKLSLWVGQWQDEIVAPPVNPLDEDYWWTAQSSLSRVKAAPLLWLSEVDSSAPTIEGGGSGVIKDAVKVIRWYQGDEIVTAVSLTADESGWAVHVPSKPKPVLSIWQWQDEITSTVLDEDYWWVASPAESRVASHFVWQIEDEQPAPVSFVPSEEDWQANTPPLYDPTVVVWAVEEDIVPQRFAGEEYWASPVPAWEKAVVQGPNWDNADLFWALEETEYQPSVFLPPVIRQIWASEEEIVPQPPISTFADEDFWDILCSREARPFITVFTADDEMGDFVPPPIIQVIETDGVRRKKKKHPKEEISELVDKIVQERPTTPPEPRLELKGLAESEKYRIVPVYKPSIEVIPLSPPAVAPEEEDDAEIVAYLVRIGML